MRSLQRMAKFILFTFIFVHHMPTFTFILLLSSPLIKEARTDFTVFYIKGRLKVGS